MREQRVQPHRIESLVAIADDLSPSVHATVCAPRHARGERLSVGVMLAEDRAQGSLQLPLHGA
jgi:hypothetical protein